MKTDNEKADEFAETILKDAIENHHLKLETYDKEELKALIRYSVHIGYNLAKEAR